MIKSVNVRLTGRCINESDITNYEIQLNPNDLFEAAINKLKNSGVELIDSDDVKVTVTME